MMKKLLTVTAVIECATGLGLLAAPSMVAHLLLGGTIETPAALTVARVAGAALIAIGVACWLSRDNARALIVAMLLYNVASAGLLVHAALALALRGFGLWPAVALHLGFAFWCMTCLASRQTTDLRT
jgi:hypothetical protein